MTDFSPLDSALHESTPEKIAASLRYLRKADAVMAALMPLSANPQALPAAVPAGYDEDEIADACIMAEVSDSKYEAIITYLGDNRRRAAALAARKGE